MRYGRLLRVSKTVTIGDITGPDGQWIVAVDDKVVVSSDNVRKMLDLTEKHPPEDAVVTRVLYPQAYFY